MRRGRIFIYIGLILILGLVAVGAFVFRNNQQQPPVTDETLGTVATQEPPQTSVIVFAQAVERGDRITSDVLSTVQIADDKKLDTMIENEEDIIGNFARFDIPAGGYAFRDQLVDKAEELSSAGSNHAIFIPPGMVAVSIPVDRLASVAYGVQRGDHVNVIVTLLMVDLDANFQTQLPNNSSGILAPGPALLATISQANAETGDAEVAASTLTVDPLLQTLTAQITSGGGISPIGRLEFDNTLGQPFYVVPSESKQRPRLVSQTLIQNVIILQIGNFALDSQTPTATTVPSDGSVPAEGEGTTPETTTTTTAAIAAVNPDTVTLIVSPQDAVTLNYLLGYFPDAVRLSLALRSAGDDSLIPTEAVTLQFLLDQYSIPVPAKLPFGLEPRIEAIVPPVLIGDMPTPEPQQ